MGDGTGIEWTDASWNPIRGCSPVSEGCRRCYAAGQAARFSGPGMPYEGLAEFTPKGPRWTGEVRVIDDHMNDPLRWTKPKRIFVNSMSDVFHLGLKDLDVARIWAVMAACHLQGKGHTFQVLTKRPDRAAQLLASERFQATVNTLATEIVDAARLEEKPPGLVDMPWPLPNVWLGASVEDQSAANHRLPHLFRAEATVRFLSLEPLLGPVDLGDPNDVQKHLHWAIVGGESGRGARPMDLAWARSLRDQCREAGVAFFFKQTGAVAASATKKGGSEADIPADLRIREFPQVTA